MIGNGSDLEAEVFETNEAIEILRPGHVGDHQHLEPHVVTHEPMLLLAPTRNLRDMFDHVA